VSILGDIVSRIFRHSPASAAPAATQSPQSKPASPQVAPPTTAGSPVDVATIMDKLASQSKEKLDWRKSIVDLMKLLKLDSSVAARKRLAEELHYTGNLKDSASMNVWLHKQVMVKLAENGGRVPNELRRQEIARPGYLCPLCPKADMALPHWITAKWPLNRGIWFLMSLRLAIRKQQIFLYEQIAQITNRFDGFFLARHRLEAMPHFAPRRRPAEPHRLVYIVSHLFKRR
jgi:hypothetical protein